MGTLFVVLVLVATSLAYPQYGGVNHEDIEQSPISDDLNQKHVSEDLNQERVLEDLNQEHFSGSLPQDDFTQDHVKKLQNFWWKDSGIFNDNQKETEHNPSPGEGVGGPFTPYQSKFCDKGFDCVPWELCAEGFISPLGGSVLQQRTKPANYETLQCGQTGNICCGIPEDILAAHKENVEGIEIIEDIPVDETPKDTYVDPGTNINPDQDPEPAIPVGPVVVEPIVPETYDPYDTKVEDEKIVETDVIQSDYQPSVNIEEKPRHGDEQCGHPSFKCVPYFLCKDGVIISDGAGLIDVRIKPQGECTNPDNPDVPGVCCQKPGLEPTPISVKQCPDHQECVEQKSCSAKGVIGTDGLGGLDLRTGHTTCYISSGASGVCCTPPPPYVEYCRENSICTSESNCLGKALNGDNEFVDYVKTGIWTQCSYGLETGICCIQPISPTLPEVIEICPENSVCMLGNQCTGKALDGSNNFVDYISSESWSSCSLGNIYGICCVLPEPVIRESCPENSVCVQGNKCSGQALDASYNFVDYVSDGAWFYCALEYEKGICCKSAPSKIVDICPGESICLKPEQCAGQALDKVNNFKDYTIQGDWSYCSQEGGVCCINLENPASYLEPATECGVRNYNIDERITTSKYGPNEAAFGEFPWQGIIFYQNYTYVCGATLVSHKHVVTAAHCIDGLQPGDIRLRFGEWQVINTDEVLPYIDRNVFKIYIHSQFNSKNVHKDIAVLELYEPVEYQYHINSVCLPQQNIAIQPNSKCFATGWGKDSFEGKFQHILKKIELPYMDHETCQDLLRKTRLGKYFRLDKSFVCAGGEENKDACYGDGGGPLVCKDELTSRYVLIGVTSWGIGCGTKDVPGVYANVPAFYDWINEIISGKYQEPHEGKQEDHHIDAHREESGDQSPHEKPQPHPQPQEPDYFDVQPDLPQPHDPKPHDEQPDLPQHHDPKPYEQQPFDLKPLDQIPQDQQHSVPQPQEQPYDPQPQEQPHDPQPQEQPHDPQPDESLPHDQQIKQPLSPDQPLKTEIQDSQHDESKPNESVFNEEEPNVPQHHDQHEQQHEDSSQPIPGYGK